MVNVGRVLVLGLSNLPAAAVSEHKVSKYASVLTFSLMGLLCATQQGH